LAVRTRSASASESKSASRAEPISQKYAIPNETNGDVSKSRKIPPRTTAIELNVDPTKNIENATPTNHAERLPRRADTIATAIEKAWSNGKMMRLR